VVQSSNSGRYTSIYARSWTADRIESDDFVGCGFHRALLQRPLSDDNLHEIVLLQKTWLHDTIAAELPRNTQGKNAARHLFLLIEGSMAAAMYEPNRQSGRDLRTLARDLLDAVDRDGDDPLDDLEHRRVTLGGA
jgi:hypothetical protein